MYIYIYILFQMEDLEERDKIPTQLSFPSPSPNHFPSPTSHPYPSASPNPLSPPFPSSSSYSGALSPSSSTDMFASSTSPSAGMWEADWLTEWFKKRLCSRKNLYNRAIIRNKNTLIWRPNNVQFLDIYVNREILLKMKGWSLDVPNLCKKGKKNMIFNFIHVLISLKSNLLQKKNL